MTEGEVGLVIALAAAGLLCLVATANAQDAAFAFHAGLGAAASVASVCVILRRFANRSDLPVPREIEGKPNYNFAPVKFAAIAAMVRASPASSSASSSLSSSALPS